MAILTKKRCKLLKLHKQFGYTSVNNLKHLLKNDGLLSTDIFKLINEMRCL